MYDSLKPKQPPCEGPQFAESMGGSDNYLSVSYDQYNNEIAEDRVMHGNATPQEGAFNFSGKQYATDFSSYGNSVSGESSSSTVMADAGRAKRGEDA